MYAALVLASCITCLLCFNLPGMCHIASLADIERSLMVSFVQTRFFISCRNSLLIPFICIPILCRIFARQTCSRHWSYGLPHGLLYHSLWSATIHPAFFWSLGRSVSPSSVVTGHSLHTLSFPSPSSLKFCHISVVCPILTLFSAGKLLPS